ncbi:hypothetical protein MKX01_014115 [Papaver californicum]|nr:hypothetical protein MKX01_014115 [Papaver californicum]
MLLTLKHPDTLRFPFQASRGGVPPSPRCGHVAAVHAERYLLIFGGGSHATYFSDLHVLGMHTMEWSKPTQKGELPTPRAGHAGVTMGENWFIVGGGDNKSGVSETIVLNMLTLVWSILTTIQGRVPLASEVIFHFQNYCSYVLVSFGGYNGSYNNEIAEENHMPESVAPKQNGTSVTRGSEYDHEAGIEGKVRKIVMDNVDMEHAGSKETSEQYIEELKSEKEEIEAEIAKEKLESLQLKQELYHCVES